MTKSEQSRGNKIPICPHIKKKNPNKIRFKYEFHLDLAFLRAVKSYVQSSPTESCLAQPYPTPQEQKVMRFPIGANYTRTHILNRVSRRRGLIYNPLNGWQQKPISTILTQNSQKWHTGNRDNNKLTTFRTTYIIEKWLDITSWHNSILQGRSNVLHIKLYTMTITLSGRKIMPAILIMPLIVTLESPFNT